MIAARGVLLKYMKVNVTLVPLNPTFAAGGDTGLFSVAFNAVRRRFSTEEVRGSFLDKSEVSDRVVSVIKNFQKVDPSKVVYCFFEKLKFIRNKPRNNGHKTHQNPSHTKQGQEEAETNNKQKRNKKSNNKEKKQKQNRGDNARQAKFQLMTSPSPPDPFFARESAKEFVDRELNCTVV
ncbi:hypothetical protein Q3G72_006544 [Acer saccharum]|nr:hypothetical protein Q3G72_006544 [Acer saccharum]